MIYLLLRRCKKLMSFHNFGRRIYSIDWKKILYERSREPWHPTLKQSSNCPKEKAITLELVGNRYSLESS